MIQCPGCHQVIGVPQEDGNNVESVYSTVQHAVKQARENIPVFLEFKTYRWLEHCGPNWDDHLGYRQENELEEWKKRCPLAAQERKLKNDSPTGD